MLINQSDDILILIPTRLITMMSQPNYTEAVPILGSISKCKLETCPYCNKTCPTSLARSATLRDTSLARLTNGLIRCLRIRWGGHRKMNFRMLEKQGGQRTFQLRVSGKIFKLGWGHHTKFWGWVGGWLV